MVLARVNSTAATESQLYDGGSTVVLRWNSLREHGRVRLGLGHGGGRNGLGGVARDVRGPRADWIGWTYRSAPA
jgi:hypothetical protein